jgi:hypothetical protein
VAEAIMTAIRVLSCRDVLAAALVALVGTLGCGPGPGGDDDDDTGTGTEEGPICTWEKT